MTLFSNQETSVLNFVNLSGFINMKEINFLKNLKVKLLVAQRISIDKNKTFLPSLSSSILMINRRIKRQ